MSGLAQRWVSVPDGNGGTRHVLRSVTDVPQRKTRRKRVVPDAIATAKGDSAAASLRQFVERVERMDEEIAEAQNDRADVLTEAKSQGFDKATILKIIARRKKEKHLLDEEDALFETYCAALGLI